MDQFGEFLEAIGGLRELRKDLSWVSPDAFYAAKDQGGWHLMSRVLTAVEDIREALDDLENE